MAQPGHSIFGRRRLTSRQLRAVAELRFDDARYLFDSGDNARATGAMYMGGFVVECLLKALLLDRHPNLQGPLDPAKLSASDGEVYSLLFGHDLQDMLDFVPEVRTKLTALGMEVWDRFRTVCEEWTIYARYSPKQAKRQEAGRFLETIKEVKEWLKQV